MYVRDNFIIEQDKYLQPSIPHRKFLCTDNDPKST